jgi:hypothetical protein
MIQGAASVKDSSCKTIKPMSGYTQTRLALVRNPQYDPRTDTTAARQRAALVEAWGGPAIGKVANHVVPDTLFDDQLAEFAPFATPGDHGSVAKAKGRHARLEARHLARRDVVARGLDRRVRAVDRADVERDPDLLRARLDHRQHFRVHGARSDTSRTWWHCDALHIPIAESTGWGKDYAEPLTFFEPLFDGRGIHITSSNVTNWAFDQFGGSIGYAHVAVR